MLHSYPKTTELSREELATVTGGGWIKDIVTFLVAGIKCGCGGDNEAGRSQSEWSGMSMRQTAQMP